MLRQDAGLRDGSGQASASWETRFGDGKNHQPKEASSVWPGRTRCLRAHVPDLARWKAAQAKAETIAGAGWQTTQAREMAAWLPVACYAHSQHFREHVLSPDMPPSYPRLDCKQLLGSLRPRRVRQAYSHPGNADRAETSPATASCFCTRPPAGRPMVAAGQSIAWATMHSHAERDSSPGGACIAIQLHILRTPPGQGRSTSGVLQRASNPVWGRQRLTALFLGIVFEEMSAVRSSNVPRT